ncbi:MAG: hypothetical protein LBG44_11790 [Gemmatimonadota bacterium]|nr:hypothetical protein [Gemmatimonadota bacterium]
MRITTVVLACIAAGAFSCADLGAQETPRPHFSANLGVFNYELADQGRSAMMAVRGSFPVSSVFSLEAGVVGSRPDQAGQAAFFLSPEAQLQLSLPFERFVPYMGLGLGAAIDFGGDPVTRRTDYNVAISGAGGVRFWLNQRIGAQAEYRDRGIGFDFAGSTSEYTLGLVWRMLEETGR